MKKTTWIYCIIIGLFLSCGDGSECMTGEVNIASLEDMGCANTTYQMSTITDQEFELIRSQGDFDALVNIDCDPNIDWNHYDLITGMKGFNRGIASIGKSLTKDCLNDRLTLRITFTLNETLVAPFVSFHALIPKLGNLESIFVEFIVVG